MTECLPRLLAVALSLVAAQSLACGDPQPEPAPPSERAWRVVASRAHASEALLRAADGALARLQPAPREAVEAHLDRVGAFDADVPGVRAAFATVLESGAVVEGVRSTGSGRSPSAEAVRQGAVAVLAGLVSAAIEADAARAEALVDLIDPMSYLEPTRGDGRPNGERSRAALRNEVLRGIGAEAWDERFPGRSPFGGDWL